MEFLSKVIPVALLSFVVSSMLAVGLSLTVGQILAPLRNRRLVLLALLANFVLMPLAAFFIARLLQLDPPLAAALLLLGTAAGAPFLPKLAMVAKGSLAFAVGLMVMLMALTVGYMPLVLPLLLEGVSVDPSKIARSLVLLMLLPLIAGLAVKSRYQEVAARLAALLNRLSTLSLVILIALLLTTNVQNILDMFGTRGVLASILFLIVSFGTGWFLGGPGIDTRGVLALGTAQRNIAAALVVGGQNFSDPKVVVMVAVVAIVGLLVLMPLARMVAGRSTQAAAPGLISMRTPLILGRVSRWIIPAGLVVAVCALTPPAPAQVRGVYPQGMNATNSGVTPEPGVTYSNLFIFFSRDHLKGSNGETLDTGQNSVMMDMNSFVWVSEKRLDALGGARFSMSATLPIANNSLTSDTKGARSGGGGFADSFYQPFILGWQKKRAEIRVVYGFLAPTGRFDATANNNVGSGYWTHVTSAGETIYLTANKRTAVSAFQMYEFHGTQEGTHIHPGQNLNLDYSLTQILEVKDGMRLQLGLVGYGQWQTTDKTGPGITPAQESERYKVNALGFASNLMLPARKVTLGAKYFKEFLNRSTFQGYSLQISGTINF